MSEQNDKQAQDQQVASADSVSEDAQPQLPASDQPLPPPAPVSGPVTQPQPPAPMQPAEPAQQSARSDERSQSTQSQQPPQQPQSKQPAQGQQPTFRENGAFSFFTTPSDPDDDPAPMSWGFKIGWFVLGLIGGMLGLLMAWISSSTLSPKRRRQAVMWTWGGFAVQAVIFLVIVLNGGSFPFLPGGSMVAQSTATGGASSASAFG